MRKLTILLLTVLFAHCTDQKKELQNFLDDYNKTYSRLYYASSEAAWKTNTEIRDGDTLNA